MNFWASSEAHQPAGEALERTRLWVGKYFRSAIASSSLAVLECKLRYVPIVMPDEMKARYPARSKLRKKDRILDCAPQLDYEVFVQGIFEDQVREYLRGIETSTALLKELGASSEQVADLQRIITSAPEYLGNEGAGKTKH